MKKAGNIVKAVVLFLTLTFASIPLKAQPADSFDINGAAVEYYRPYNYFSEVFDTLNIGNGNPGQYQLLFRLVHEGKIIELRSTDLLDFRLVQYFFAWECFPNTEQKEKLHIDSIVYPDTFAAQFYSRFVSGQIHQLWLPDSTGIGMIDGTVYTISLKQFDTYYYRIYSQSRYLEFIDTQQLKVHESGIVGIFRLLDTENSYRRFISKKRLTCYRNGGWSISRIIPQKKKSFLKR